MVPPKCLLATARSAEVQVTTLYKNTYGSRAPGIRKVSFFSGSDVRGSGPQDSGVDVCSEERHHPSAPEAWPLWAFSFGWGLILDLRTLTLWDSVGFSL